MACQRHASGPQVGFVETDPPQERPPPVHQVRPKAVIKPGSQFCELIKRRIGPAKICLQAKDNKLFQLPDLAEVDDDIADAESISLSDMLQQHDVAVKKLLLAYVLAKSVWQYYNSDWMSVRWTPRSVQFFHERRGDDDDDDSAGPLDGSPYVVLPNLDTAPSLLSAEHIPTEAVVHRYPRLLALGMLLLEIGRPKRRACRQRPPEQETIVERISTDLNNIRRALKPNSKWPSLNVQEEARQSFKAVLENCSNPRIFETDIANSTDPTDGGLTIEERRAIIYRRVVHPLKSLMEKLDWPDVSGNIKSQDGVENNNPHVYPGNGVDTSTAAFLNTGSGSDPSQNK